MWSRNEERYGEDSLISSYFSFLTLFSYLVASPSLLSKGKGDRTSSPLPPLRFPLPLSLSTSFPPSRHLSSRCHVVDEFNQKLICHCLENTHQEWEHPVLWHIAKTITGRFVCAWASWENLFVTHLKRLSFNGNLEVNKVVPAAFVI